MPWSIVNLAVCFLAFGTLARLCPCNPSQPRFANHEQADNALYWLVSVLFYGDLSALILKFGLGVTFQGQGPSVMTEVMAGYGWASRAPLLLQAALVIIAMDIIQYGLHRAFHSRWLWPFHAIHHSAQQVDWTTTYRIYPVNFLIYSAGAMAVVRLIGFSPATFFILGPFNLVVGSLVHANLNWTFGPFRCVLASPVYHRWHHVRDPAVRDRNFAPTFPVLDLMFGTYHMPKGRLPADYGVDGVPDHFFGQLIYPFAAIAARFGLGRKAGADQATA